MIDFSEFLTNINSQNKCKIFFLCLLLSGTHHQQQMLPFSQRERKHTQNFQFTTCASLQRKTTGCATHSRASSLEVEGKKKKKQAISQEITTPERAAMKTQVSKQICTTRWNTAQQEDEYTCPTQLPRRKEELKPQCFLQHLG